MYPIFRVYTLQKGQVRVWDVVPVSRVLRVLWHGGTELAEVSGTDMNVVHIDFPPLFIDDRKRKRVVRVSAFTREYSLNPFDCV